MNTGETMSDENEGIQSAISYVGGGGLITSSLYADLTNGLHIIALFLGVVLICIRIFHDIKKLRKK